MSHPPAGRRESRATAAVGVLGELLITAGVLVGLFVVWQLWWTDVQSGRTQTELLDSLTWAAPQDLTIGALELRHDQPPEIPPAEPGTTFATMQVPRWGEDYLQPITAGVGRRAVLDSLGIGHYPGTAMPGGVGNFALAAHRTTYGKPFHRVEELQAGDPLVIRTQDTWFVYRVTASQIVRPSQVDVVAPIPGDPGAVPTQSLITLTTCHPMYSAAERYIVHGELDYWMPTADGVPPDLQVPSSSLGGG